MSADIDNRVTNKIVFSVLITLLWLMCPIISVGVIIFLIYKINPRYYSLKYLFLLIALSFGLIAYTALYVNNGGEPTDITRYSTQFRTLSGINTFSEFFISGVLADGGIYLIFEGVSFLLAKIFPDNPQVLVLFWVSFAYFFLLLGIWELTRYKEKWSKDILLILMLLVLFGTSLFMLEVELLKQSSATALAAYAIFRKMNNRKYSGWIFFASLLIHASGALYIPILLFIRRRIVNKYYIVILGLCCIISLVDINRVISVIGPAALADKAKFYASIDSWTINKINYVLIVLYALFVGLSLYDTKRKERSGDFYRLAFNVNVLSFSLLLTQFHSVHNFVRYTYLYSPFYVLSFFLFIIGNINKVGKISIALFYIVFMIGLNCAYTMMYLNSTYTNSYMDNSVINLLTSSVYGFLSHKVVN